MCKKVLSFVCLFLLSFACREVQQYQCYVWNNMERKHFFSPHSPGSDWSLRNTCTNSENSLNFPNKALSFFVHKCTPPFLLLFLKDFIFKSSLHSMWAWTHNLSGVSCCPDGSQPAPLHPLSVVPMWCCLIYTGVLHNFTHYKISLQCVKIYRCLNLGKQGGPGEQWQMEYISIWIPCPLRPPPHPRQGS